jgi:hypothetical protein
MARAQRFYESVLGVTLQAMPVPASEPGAPAMQMLFFPGDPERAGCAGALVRMEGAPVGGGSTIVYFSCADCALEAGRVASAGGKIFKTKTAIGPYGHIALIVDTEGNMVGLHSMA